MLLAVVFRFSCYLYYSVVGYLGWLCLLVLVCGCILFLPWLAIDLVRFVFVALGATALLVVALDGLWLCFMLIVLICVLFCVL